MLIPRRSLFVVVAALAPAGCGPSAAQIREAREARYDAGRADVFQVASEVVAEDPGLDLVDPETAVLISAGRWYEAGGAVEDEETTPSGDQAVILHHGSLLLAYRVAVVGEAPPFQVVVESVVDQWLVGATSLYRMKPDDPDVPSWVQDRVDNLQLAIHRRLQKRFAPTTRPFAAASASPANPRSAR